MIAGIVAGASVEIPLIPWTPAQITTQLWLDAADATTITTVSGAVSQWNDKSGNGRHVTQLSSATERPLYNSSQLNSLPVLTWDGSNDLIGRSGPIAGLGQNVGAISVFVVRRWASSPTGGTRHMLTIARFDNTASRLDLQGGRTNNRESIGGRRLDAGTFREITAGTDVSAATWNIVSGHLDWANALGSMFIDGSVYAAAATITDAGSTSNVSAGNLNLGSRLDFVTVELFNGDIAELIVRHAVDTTERQLIEGYLAWKWGLQASLPGGHPYLSAPPST